MKKLSPEHSFIAVNLSYKTVTTLCFNNELKIIPNKYKPRT